MSIQHDRARDDARPEVHARPGRIEADAVIGVVAREWILYGQSWRATTFAAVVEPTLYLLCFGFGMGALIGTLAGFSYIDFLGTGIVAVSVMFQSMMPAVINTFIKRRFLHTYEGILAAPVDVRELVTGEALWLAMRSGVYGCVPLLVAVGFGLRPGPGMLLVPFIAFLAGFAFALFGIWISAVITSVRSMDYVFSGLFTPLFLVAGTFFPLTELPAWVQNAAMANPLYHAVELIRGSVFGGLGAGAALLHVGVLLGFIVLMWFLAGFQMRRRVVG
ncbi:MULTISPECIES: ABC transporter permease [Nocardiopsidaceae]|jgi:lipooligosaccharide transport system permease protein|uniref:Transport permease protein n=2 Tax=Nocardiopsidaceae TaxID=83676 RepID=A0ABY6YKD9_9ACTN|nr:MULTISPECIES: ABC transporter permease [Nocardiopsaceae]MEE2054732.1 ABC transporter permease [Nocardiopsis umidischolae]WAE72743.1 ABC transporter permease [Streptomonospora nanhaiensis]